MGGIVAAVFIAKHQDRALSGTLGGMGWLKPGGAAQWMFSQIKKNDPKPTHWLSVGVASRNWP